MNENNVNLNEMNQNIINNETNNINQLNSDFQDINKKNKIIFPMIILIILFVSFCGVSWFYYNNPKVIFAKTVNKHFNNTILLAEANPLLNSLYNSNEIGVTSDIEISLKDSMGLTDNFQNLKLALEYIENKATQNGYVNAKAILNDNESLELNALMKDEKLYFNIKDILDKYYYIDHKFISYLNENKITPENIEYILGIFKENMINILKTKELDTEKVTIKVNDEKIKVQKISLEVTEKILYDITSKSLNQIKNDNKALEIISVMVEEPQNEIKNTIDKFLELDQDLDENNVLFTYSIYNKLLTGVIKEEIYNDDFSFSFTNYEEKKNYIISFNKEEILNIKINNTEKNTLIDGNIYIFEVTGNYDKENFYIKFNAEQRNSSSLEITGEYKTNEITSGSKIEEILNFNLNYKADSNTFNIDFKSKTIIENNKVIPITDISNSKSVDDITDEEITNAYMKAEENEFVKSVVDAFMSSYGNNVLDAVTNNTYCAQAFNCEEAIDGTYNCQYCNDPDCLDIGVINCQ